MLYYTLYSINQLHNSIFKIIPIRLFLATIIFQRSLFQMCHDNGYDYLRLFQHYCQYKPLIQWKSEPYSFMSYKGYRIRVKGYRLQNAQYKGFFTLSISTFFHWLLRLLLFIRHFFKTSFFIILVNLEGLANPNPMYKCHIKEKILALRVILQLQAFIKLYMSSYIKFFFL